MSVSFKVRRFEWRGPEVSARVNVAGGQGVKNAAQSILDDAEPYVPFEDGDLLASGRAEQDRDNLGWFTNGATVSYDTPYAVKLHEHPEFNFKGSGEGKWLEHALQRRAGRILMEDIAPPIMRVLALP